MRPEDVGLSHTNLVLGKHSGRHAFRDRAKELGFDLNDTEINLAFQDFKKLADKKKDIYDGDIESIIMNASGSISGPWSLKALEIKTHTDLPATATVSLKGENGVVVSKSANASNPLIDGMKPILGCDLWEHSYYVDYKNRRLEYLENFYEKLINWEFVESNLD